MLHKGVIPCHRIKASVMVLKKYLALNHFINEVDVNIVIVSIGRS